MTRKEQIEKAAEDFAGINYDIETEADSLYHYVQKEAFMAGTEWADKTMLESLRQFIDHHTEIKDVYRFIKYMEEQQ